MLIFLSVLFFLYILTILFVSIFLRMPDFDIVFIDVLADVRHQVGGEFKRFAVKDNEGDIHAGIFRAGLFGKTLFGSVVYIVYKAVVKAYIIQGGVKTYVKTGPTIYAYTSGGTKKLTNPECVIIKKTKVVLKTGHTHKIKANVTKLKKHRKLIGKGCAAKLRFISSDTSVAEVSRSGKITAKRKGSCMVYVYAVNGVRNAVAVTVK